MTPCGRATAITNELLKDGQVRSRKNIVDEVSSILIQNGFNDSKTTIDDGINYALRKLNCKIGSNLYQVPLSNDRSFLVRNLIEACQDFSNGLRAAAKNLDYVNADEINIELLKTLRRYFEDTQEWIKEIECFEKQIKMSNEASDINENEGFVQSM